MDTLGLSTQCKLRQCSQCQRDTEFYCNTCKRDLCLQCKKKHVTENNTKYHNVVFYITRHTERSFTTQCKLRQCSQCQGDTEFYCNTCKRDLCLQCKEKHVNDLDTIYHDVVIYREKFNCFPLRETCVRHPKRKYRMFCDQCNYSVCKCCTDHRTHALVDLRTAYQTKRQQHREIIDNIRSETLYNCRVLLAGIQTDIQSCPPQICHRQSQQMSTKAQRLKDRIDTVVCDVKLLIDRIQQQKRKMNRQLVHLQNYEDRYEQSANRAVQFLLFIKTSRVPQIKNSPSQLLSVITEIQMTTGKRQVGIDECVKLMSTPVLHTSVCVTGVSRVFHISRVMSDRVWVSDKHNLILTDTTGDTIHRVTDIAWYRGHTVNSSGELIYIDSDDNINKLSTDNKTLTRLIQSTSPWRPRCVYCSPSTGDLMVGMSNTDTKTAKVTRYNSSGQHILTIEHDNTGHTLYSRPLYITENNNGDIIVSDYINSNRGAVVVTERGGRHRFSYTGPPSGSSLAPCGICTDALSHILVCDYNTHTVQMIDKDGHFLSLLLTQHGINRPCSLNYDDKTHLLWVGSDDTNTVSVYRYLQRRYSLTDYPDSEEYDTREKSDTDDKDARGKSDSDDEDAMGKSDPDDKDARGKSFSDDEDSRGKSDPDDKDARGKSDSDDEDAMGKSDPDDKDARGKSVSDDEDSRGKSDPDDKDARGKSDSDDEDAWGKSDSDDEDAWGKFDTEDKDASRKSDANDKDARGKSDANDKDASRKSDSDDKDTRGKSDDEDARGKSDDEDARGKSDPKSF
ncbi:uncharacterized protein LOC125672635 [Ostrea edulis]|uniref:uncharacterized protein LOC125672635 n=1 Tax=Ostrea edulis TaxID=37623 RepID=UPI0024AF8910|nr:uncharacterized protein LOC125672635 [Ostrea edulis]XP_056007476.1 uncharacterized protein LOC125672635 [Ostrea edulis]XP_056007477.1 uncharacterized protein LOC125672635 [Ostrea edulis]XP_056007478.1 uncharacterized protein LOC125672635 [Ostrea edulis]XP_056007479.1 uncharacterized protein LOC125672635 [Ostrea edulis]XP_056007480.1 uncharacterized protein LOC125672635 [Ostrea edulis]XP_056007481.1 uncharacterized protein LOC125672635 [Ostrea edulis]XP_056007482.1 uncharacterized protein 